MRRIAGLVATVILLPACGQDPEPAAPDTVGGSSPLDVRVALPEPDPSFYDIVTPEVVIEPGTEKMYCHYQTYDGDDVAVPVMETFQGKFGHHVTILSTFEPKPDGTFEDCTLAKDMKNFRAYIFPDTPLPDGYGLRLRRGVQFVIQFHYVNTGSRPILVRDLARVKKMPIDGVRTWVSTLTTNSLRVKLPAALPATETFDCTLDRSVELMLVGGHMHENGDRIEIAVGANADALEPVYTVGRWKAEYRDAPPISLMWTQPKRLERGTIVRTTCNWKNPTTRELSFPEEMCSSFAYIAGSEDAVHCEAKDP